MLQGSIKIHFFLTYHSQILVNLKPQVALNFTKIRNRVMCTQIHKSYYLYIKIMPFTKKYFVVGVMILKIFNIFKILQENFH